MNATLIKKRVRAISGLLCALSVGGCAGMGVKPWDRDILARQSMQLNGYPQLTAFKEHIFFSKEGSSGGRTFDGGGCGCN
jgi:hypothetical protein